MTRGFLVKPDLSNRIIEFDEDDCAYPDEVQSLLAEATRATAFVAFAEESDPVQALYSTAAKANGEDPNPVASLGRSTHATGHAEFLADPGNALFGPVVFIGIDGGNIKGRSIDDIDNAIRAVRNYREDNLGEYRLWCNAVRVLRIANAEHVRKEGDAQHG